MNTKLKNTGMNKMTDVSDLDQILVDSDARRLHEPEARAALLRNQMGIMSETDLAILVDMKPSSIANWRAEKTGPDFCKLGRYTFYRLEDVKEWIDSQVTVIARR